MNKIIEWALSVLLREQDQCLYGSVTFTYQNGKIVSVKVEKSEKPPVDSFMNKG